MEQYISKSAVVAEIERLHKEWRWHSSTEAKYRCEVYRELSEFLNTLEVKEVGEKAVSNDLEDYANKESESFAEREYEIDYIDRNALAKGRVEELELSILRRVAENYGGRTIDNIIQNYEQIIKERDENNKKKYVQETHI